ncbi:hypothetical protein BZA70DRAFT_19626 [Myxozyma melibiosi]|uniref:MARVEL domain-containing protein n=1 Tax=Myxozyma melibiosi TaxID=54550 RepID=A0ABR1FCM5_9ASCO
MTVSILPRTTLRTVQIAVSTVLLALSIAALVLLVRARDGADGYRYNELYDLSGWLFVGPIAGQFILVGPALGLKVLLFDFILVPYFEQRDFRVLQLSVFLDIVIPGFWLVTASVIGSACYGNHKCPRSPAEFERYLRSSSSGSSESSMSAAAMFAKQPRLAEVGYDLQTVFPLAVTAAAVAVVAVVVNVVYVRRVSSPASKTFDDGESESDEDYEEKEEEEEEEKE